MLLAHRIRIEATPAQRDYFARAAGTARKVWNWALAQWHSQVELGQWPQAKTLKKAFNAIKYVHPDWLDAQGSPWLKTIHRDAHAQPFAHLDRFYVANDKFRLEGRHAVLPKIGTVVLAESLRLNGKIMGACVSREADHWYLAVQVDLPEQESLLPRSGDDVIGVDLGISAAAVLSSGEKIASPRPLRKAQRRLRIRSRRHARKLEAAKRAVGIQGVIPKGVRLPVSRNRKKAAQALARLHARIAHIRADFTHKLTTRLCRENQAVAIEDLNVRGMLANHRLARAIADVGFYEVRRQLQYKAQRYRTLLVLADRWYPSSKLCAVCGAHNASLTLNERDWHCQCGAHHDRDVNAAINLQRLATDALAAIKALPVASLTATSGTAANIVLAGGGKVTPVRYEYGQQDGSGQ